MNDIFLKNLPYIDLHGYDMDSARVATNDFINDNLLMKNPKVLIIHGKGKGLVKKSVQDTLAHRKEVRQFYIDNFNDGVTIVHLNVDN